MKSFKYGKTKGYNYDYVNGSELGYCEKRGQVNDIVIHNPVSVANCSIKSTDSKYDMRTEGSKASGSANFAVLDRTVTINFPSSGFHAGNGDLGILDTRELPGRGYQNIASTEQWTRDKFVVFPFSVITSEGYTYIAGTPINLYYLNSDGTSYTFKLPLANYEVKNAEVTFIALATNAEKIEYYDESNGETNKERTDAVYAARHTAHKFVEMDIVGSIGALTIEDVGDFRFAELFKVPYPASSDKYGWLIENVVHKVDVTNANHIVVDGLDVRGEKYSEDTDYGDTFGTQAIRADSSALVKMPLTPLDNNIKSLRKQPMRPGYRLYMDVSTIGNYYGMNTIDESSGNLITDVNNTDKEHYMKIKPKYFALDLNKAGTSAEYIPLDCYYKNSNNEYIPCNLYYNDVTAAANKFSIYFEWAEEYARRNYIYKFKGSSYSEKNLTDAAVKYLSNLYNLYIGTGLPGDSITLVDFKSPNADKVLIGTAEDISLADVNRTFIGSSSTYGVDNSSEDLDEDFFKAQAQKWHFTLALPSSVVFVEAGKPCTSMNVKEIQTLGDTVGGHAGKGAVIVCTLDIRVGGEVWTLEYDGTTVNNADTDGTLTGIQISDDPELDDIYCTDSLPSEGKTDPIIAVFSNKYTAADDLRSEGSH